MVVAAVNDNWYNVVLLLHSFSIIGTGAHSLLRFFFAGTEAVKVGLSQSHRF